MVCLRLVLMRMVWIELCVFERLLDLVVVLVKYGIESEMFFVRCIWLMLVRFFGRNDLFLMRECIMLDVRVVMCFYVLGLYVCVVFVGLLVVCWVFVYRVFGFLKLFLVVFVF